MKLYRIKILTAVVEPGLEGQSAASSVENEPPGKYHTD